MEQPEDLDEHGDAADAREEARGVFGHCGTAEFDAGSDFPESDGGLPALTPDGSPADWNEYITWLTELDETL